MVRTEHPQCWLLWKHPSKKTLTFTLTLCDRLFCSSAWLDWETSYPLMKHIFGCIYEDISTGLTEKERFTLNVSSVTSWDRVWDRMKRGEGEKEKASWCQHFQPFISLLLSLLLLLLHHFSPWLLGDFTECPPTPVLPTLPLSSPPYGLPSKKNVEGRKKPNLCCHTVTRAWSNSQGPVP